MIHNKDDVVHQHPEEKEYHRKREALHKHYTIDVRAGDIVRYVSDGRKYFGLVVETAEKPDHRSGTGVVSGKIDWSITAPADISGKRWHEFNSAVWSVMNR